MRQSSYLSLMIQRLILSNFILRKLNVLRKRFSRLLWIKFNIDRDYLVAGTKLKLPAEHLLPEHQATHPLYDKFLPFIVKELNSNSYVLDIGANVGDSLSAMLASNGNLNYLCIEPEPIFIKYLEQNIETLRVHYPESNIKIDKG